MGLSPKAGYLLGLASLLLGAAWLVPHMTATLALAVTGLAFLFLTFLVRVLNHLQRRANANLFKAIGAIVENDPAFCFSTDGDGAIGYMNHAARKRFDAPGAGDPGQGTLISALGDTLASPAAVLHRLMTRASAKGYAQEDVAQRRGSLRLCVHQMGRNAYLWRLEDLAGRGGAMRSGEVISLPMMTVAKSGTILFMNDALRRLIGRRETTLDRVFSELPLKPGEVMRVTSRDGPMRVLVCEIASSGGRSEIYLLPEPKQTMVSAGEWGVIDTLPVPLLKLGAEGEILMANRRARALLGEDSPRNARLSDLVEGLGRPISEWLREVEAGRLLGRSEIVRAVKPEKDVFLQISLRQVPEDDGRVLIAVLHDATELKTMEAQFVQSQKMQAIGQLAGGVAHDFNNLLTAISGHCDLLLLKHDESDPDFADLAQIQQNSNRAASLVGQLLAFSRKQTLRTEIVDLSDTLSDLTHLLNRLVGERVALELREDNALLPIRADKRQLEQVLMNLVVNARDAMPSGGTICVETRNVILDGPLERDSAVVPVGDYVSILVTDQGTGISPDAINKIFEPFYTTKKTGSGTGLGLSMAYGIVKQSGGFIFVDSVLGVGTTFTLYFPVCRLTPQEKAQTAASRQADQRPANDARQDTVSQEVNIFAPAPPPAAADGDCGAAQVQDAGGATGGIVLLVEDEAPVRAFASRALRMRGFTVVEASNADEALDALAPGDLEVDVFVTDVVMPGMDGPTWVAKALKTRPDVRVVFVSGYAEDSVAEHQARIPNSVFLPKPFSLSELTQTVQAQMAHSP